MIHTKKRSDVIDILRGIAIILVVLGHTIQYTLDAFDMNMIFRLIYSFHMPLFFLISGYCTMLSGNIIDVGGAKRKLLKLVSRTLKPYLIWTMILWICLCAMTKHVDFKLGWNISFGNSKIFWFLWSLFWCQMAFLIAGVFSAPIKKPQKNFIAQMIAYAILGWMLSFCDFVEMKWLLYFALGIVSFLLYGKYEGFIKSHSKQFLTIGTVIWICLLPWWLRTESPALLQVLGIKGKMMLATEKLYRLIVALAGSSAILGVTMGSNKTKIFSKELSFYGRNSLGVYVVSTGMLFLANNQPIISEALHQIHYLVLFTVVLLFVTFCIKMSAKCPSVSRLLFGK